MRSPGWDVTGAQISRKGSRNARNSTDEFGTKEKVEVGHFRGLPVACFGLLLEVSWEYLYEGPPFPEIPTW